MVFHRNFSALLICALAFLSPFARAGVILSENFDPVSLPWTLVSSGGVIYGWDLGSCGMALNMTGGTGDVFCANSDLGGPGAFDLSLISPVLDLSGAGSASLSYRADYQNSLGQDTLDLDVSTNGGVGWINVLRWQESHGGAYPQWGVAVTVDLTPYLSPNFRFRWRYYDPNYYALAWYFQLDDIQVTTGAAPEIPEPGTAALLAGGLSWLLLWRRRR